MAASPKKLSNKEIAWYVIASLIGILGLIFLVFGIIGANFPGAFEDNWIAASENVWLKNWSPFGYRWWGVILVAIAAALAIIVLTVFAKEGDRDTERALRRQQRLAMSNVVEEPKDELPSPKAEEEQKA